MIKQHALKKFFNIDAEGETMSAVLLSKIG